ncbi:MAG: hypothetical protein QOG53_18 [Frankiales bacterium]|jgi:hypothetical protein|nr:hypothetical protein [Frankiales bacterium]
MSTDDARAPRSLADWLRTAADDDLAALLEERPDLVTPLPPDLTVLSARAATRPSVLAALDRLRVFDLEILELLTALPELASYNDVIAATSDAPEGAVRDAVDRLRRLALVWGDDSGLHVLRTVRELVVEPAGLGPTVSTALNGTSSGRLRDILDALGLPASSDRYRAIETLSNWAADGDAVRTVINDAPEDARDVIDRLVWGPPTGRTDRSARSPGVAWLLQRGLLVSVDEHTVVLPREIALALRGGAVLRETHPVPPELESVAGDADRAAHAAATHATTFVRAIEELLDGWALDPPPVLRTGGLGVRELRRAAARLDRPDHEVALLAETAYVAGLLAAVPAGGWLPTPAYDGWRDAPDAQSWALLGTAWLLTSRVAGLTGARDDRDRALAPLGPDLDRAFAPRLRSNVLQLLSTVASGASTTGDSIASVLRWLSPRRGGRLREDLVAWTLAEAELIGITGAGALSPAGRHLLEGNPVAAADALARLLPEPVDYVLIQADMTAVAPGPLTRDLARELALVADVESTGHATVYRFTEPSVRRALDAGRGATDVHELLTRHSRTPVPQPLTYLINDVARRHGKIRVGVASSYIRCDDPSVIGELIGSRRTAALGLRRLAPTVVAAEAAPDRVLALLRELGYAPAAESAAGDVVIARPDERRAPRTAPPQPTNELSAPSPELVGAAVRALRAGDRASTVARRPVTVTDPPSGVMPSSSSAQTLSALQEAARDGTSLWIGYVNAQGRATQRVVEPMSVDGGYLRAFDHLHDELRTFAIHRITGIAELVEEEANRG